MNSQNKNLPFTGIWYGKASTENNLIELWRNIESCMEEKEKLWSIIEMLKIGEFSAKKHLTEIIIKTKNKDIKNLSLRVFCSVAKHEDIDQFDNILKNAEENEIKMFVLYSIHTLSLEIIPYILALLEDWKGTELEQSMRYSLEMIFPYRKFLGDDCSLDDIGEFYREKITRLDCEKYYFQGEPIFIGTLTKELINYSIIAKKEARALQLTNIPTLLSIFSGIECPVNYSTIIDDKIMGQILNYVKQLASMEWEKGCKYFYGHKL